MTNDEKLARWQGCSPSTIVVGWQHPVTDHVYFDEYPDYLNDAAACDSLLDTLVEKGYEYSLFGNQRIMNNVDFRIYKDDVGVCMSIKSARREAIIAACLDVARKESEQ